MAPFFVTMFDHIDTFSDRTSLIGQTEAAPRISYLPQEAEGELGATELIWHLQLPYGFRIVHMTSTIVIR